VSLRPANRRLLYEFEADRPAFDLLCGTQAVRDAIELWVAPACVLHQRQDPILTRSSLTG
jgi:hypothetical protein